jgi:hypothetical protein
MISRLILLLAAPVLVAVLCIFGPFTTDPALLFSGLATDLRPGWLPGFGTADPNMGITSDALGKRAVLEILSGTLPLWDHLEGLGAPLLGSMQPAALFPPTLLLLLPHGQVIEQTFLQFVAGLGTYLFLRSFGLGRTAALAGGVLFELNGVFALLRNAVFNPVAFLPWLLYVVEALRQRGTCSWRARLPFIGLGALAAALALYAGFPEVVYLYALLIFAWVAVRAAAMPLVQAARFLASLAAAALLGLVIAAPVLLAFVDFLPEAVIGFHAGEDLPQSSLLPTSLLLSLLPWVYGPIAGAPVLAAATSWNGMGGYLCLMPALLAIAGLYCGRRQAICWLMAAWSLASIAASHGAPVLYPLFLHVPLVKLTLFFRYLDSGWILCCIALGAIYLDRLPAMSREQWRRACWISLGGTAAALVLALLLAASALAALSAFKAFRLYEIAYLVLGLVLVVAFAAARSRRVLITLAVAEAAVTFLFPLASFSRAHRLDWPLITFLREHVGLQRMAVAVSGVVNPNYATAFGFASINYDNLPVPARTAAFARVFLDPKLIPGTFWPKADWSRSDDDLRSAAQTHVSGYENAAVRYLVGPQDLFGTPAYALSPTNVTPLQLSAGDELTVRFRSQGTDIREAGLFLGTFSGSADGMLRARLCQGETCAEASADLTKAGDNRWLSFRFELPLPLAGTHDLELTVGKQGGQHPVVLWARPAAPPDSGIKPLLVLVSSDAPRPVFESTTASVFELPQAKDYASAPGCRTAASSRDQFQVACEAPSRLIRREVWMQGWTARVNGLPAPVQLADDTFQAVDLPAGPSTVAFRYDPTGVRASTWPALVALLLALALLATARFARKVGSP